MRHLIVDPEFRDKIPPLSEDEFLKLEENIVSDGEVREPLVVWNNTIIDGHHRWKIIQKHPEIPYRVKDMDFADKWAAIVWMCRNQLGRRNVTDEQKTVLIGEAYKAQKMSVGNHAERGADGRYLSAQNEHKGKNRTSDVIARDFGVGKETVKRAEHFLDGLNEAEKVSPGIKESILIGEVKAPKKVIFYPIFYPLQLLWSFTAFYTETRKPLKTLGFFDWVLRYFTLLSQFKSGCHLQMNP